MEAIPSLCASTASCGIASIGYALAEPTLPKQPPPKDLLNSQFSSSSPQASRQLTSSITTPPRQAKAIKRSSSATNSILPTPERGSFGDRGVKEDRTLLDEEEGKSNLYAGIDTERLEDDSVTKRTSWVRRLSTIAPSLDGSIGSPSLNRPSTPSVFSNGSNVPLFSHPSPVTPRNKLVKRSTSQRVLHSDSASTSPFSVRSTTFRRPATSYQRSENLRLQTAQQSLGLSEKVSQPLQEHLNESDDPDSISAHTNSSVTKKWRPFFRYRRKLIGPEHSSRRSSFSRILGSSDHISCVVHPGNTEPVLIGVFSLRKPTMEPSRQFDSPLRGLDELVSDSEIDMPKALAARGERKSRNSFSIGDFIPSSSPSWKMNRGGSLKRKKGRDGAVTGRRIVSAPQQNIGANANRGAMSLEKSEDGTSTSKTSELRNSSSPLPPLEQLSAFEIDLPGTSSSNHTGSMGEDSSYQAYQESPLAPFPSNQGGPGTARTRSYSHRASRVPSEHSTTFGSENEHSRVFSLDGDDGEIRSETAYDSLRTEASGSSHSGARSHRVEAVFGDQTPPESLKQNPMLFQEKLARFSLISYRKPENFIEEEESLQTPTRGRGLAGISDSILLPAKDDPLLNNSPFPPRSANGKAKSFPNSYGQDTLGQGEKRQTLKSESMPDIEEDDWDDEMGIKSTAVPDMSQDQPMNRPNPRAALSSHPINLPERPKSNIFEWSERQPLEKGAQPGSSLRPRTAYPQQNIERGGRPSGRRPPSGMHLRSQSVPLPPENSKHRFNNSAKLDSWKLGSKGESEKWDNDFEFEEPSSGAQDTTEGDTSDHVVVPQEILEKQPSVHNQFGQVRELSLLVEELRRLHHQGSLHGLLTGQSSGLWKEAEGIIDLATLDEDEPPRSPNSTSFDFDAFDEDSPSLAGRQRRSSAARSRTESQGQKDSSPATQPTIFSSPAGSRQGTPKGRPRQDSVARAKNILENINHHRSTLDPPLEPVEEHSLSGSPSKKMPFDTTSLRDLVTRAGVVTRALKEIIRKAEDPEYVPQTPERRSASPPDPPFVSHIFYQTNTPHSSPSPSNDRKSPPVTERSGGALPVSPLPSHDNEVHGHSHGHVHMMTVV